MADDEPEDQPPSLRLREIYRRLQEQQSFLESEPNWTPDYPDLASIMRQVGEPATSDADTPEAEIEGRVNEEKYLLAKNRRQTAEDNRKQRRRYAGGMLLCLALQLIVANVFFGLHGQAVGWDFEPEVILGFLTATVVEIIGVVLVITQYLFRNEATPD